ncbi:hypothetical protein GSI_04486 [Ganoderma sinense ZZ0214-1]|uniref:Polysaccharide lyase 14 domain-containing protein n=1 Tax=Ganoderma sinense ZZ0214-1 TaxID=1077348 RepID=A0A2G8SH59_9APHY|nr:hypothetical protein GSI_04486 [Ganoderma sinense ZZ0214-1]
MLATIALAFGLASTVSALPLTSDATLAARATSVLFPISNSPSWSVSKQVSNALPFTDATLNITKLINGFTHKIVKAPDGVTSIESSYPKGSFNPSHTPKGGISFYAAGPKKVDLTTAQEVTLSYSVFFPDGFDFVKGGKLPGLYGGNSDKEATGCSGGRRDNGCFSARFMWRREGAGEIYTYLPPGAPQNKAVCKVPPQSECNDVYGASVGRGSFKFTPGKRTIIGQRIRLNDVGKANGELELFVNGKSIYTVPGLVLRTAASGRIRGIQMQSFFGGSDSTWATPKDQNAFFGDFSVAITKKL